MTVQFPELSELLGNDQSKVRLVVRVFYRWAVMDMQRLEHAAAARQWNAVRELAQRIHVGCLQICERNAADAAAELGRVPGEHFADAYARRRTDIVELLDRAEEFSRCRL
jgi:hypothetical protein